MKRTALLTLSILLAGVPALLAQQPAQTPATTQGTEKPISASLGAFVFPAKGQNAEQQKKDEMDCFTWAKQQTGIDPIAQQTAAQPQQPAPKADAPKGGTVKGAAGGAAAGAAIGAVAGDAGTGAAVGATAGAIKGRRDQKKAEKKAEATAQQQQQQAQQQAQAAQKEKMDTFKRAFSACMEGKGYTVK